MKEGYALADQASRQLYAFIRYLESNPNANRVEEGTIAYRINA
jgi:hypothetical protein